MGERDCVTSIQLFSSTDHPSFYFFDMKQRLIFYTWRFIKKILLSRWNFDESAAWND